jgi:hypothetical protein
MRTVTLESSVWWASVTIRRMLVQLEFQVACHIRLLEARLVQYTVLVLVVTHVAQLLCWAAARSVSLLTQQCKLSTHFLLAATRILSQQIACC